MAKKRSERKKKKVARRTGRTKAATPRRAKTTLRRDVAGGTTQAARLGLKRVRKEEDGAGSAGQSGGTQGLRRAPLADSESVEELVEEGQYFEAEAVSGVEQASDTEGAEVRTGEVPEDDVPEEYRDLREKED